MFTKMQQYYLGVVITIFASLACSILNSPATMTVPTPVDEPAQTEEPGPPLELLPTIDLPTEFVPPQPKTGKIGEVIQSGDLTLYVVGWDIIPAAEYTKPNPGKKFMAVEIVLVNSGESSLRIGHTEFYIKDSTGQLYEKDYSAEMAGGFQTIQMELAPGERVWGKVGFQVPESAGGLQFVFEMGSWMEANVGKIFVDLDPQPVQVQLPGDLPGERKPQLHSASQPVQLDDVVITINGVGYPEAGKYTFPLPGNKFMVVDVTFENKGSSSVPLYTGLLLIKDSRDWLCLEDGMAIMAAGGSRLQGELTAGEKLRGQVGFQVPENATGLILVFDNDIYKPGKVFIALQ
jgi:hypothetical protein